MKIFLLLIIFMVRYQLYPQLISSAESDRLGKNVFCEDGKSYMLFFNPAGLYNIKSEINIDYHSLYPGLTDKTEFVNNTVYYVHNILGGGIGFGVNWFGVKNLYENHNMFVSYGRRLKNRNLSLGVKLRFLYESYKIDDNLRDNPVFKQTDKWFFPPALSFGMLYKYKLHKFGIVIDNIISPNIGFYTEEYLPREIKFGYGYEFNSIKILISFEQKFNVVQDYNIGGAIEYKFLVTKWLKIVPSTSLVFGSRNYDMLYLGLSFYTPRINVSLSYNTPLSTKIDVGNTYRISIGYKFYPEEILEEKVSKKEYDELYEERNRLVKEIEELKKKLKQKKLLNRNHS